MQLNIATPEQRALVAAANRSLELVECIVIDSPEMFVEADKELKAIKEAARKLEDQRTSITRPLNEALRSVNELFREPSNILATAERKLKGSMLTFQQEQERIAAEEQRRRDEEARQEQERLRREAAERERLAREEAARLQADAARLKAEGEAEAEKLREQAKQAQDEGRAGDAADLFVQAETRQDTAARVEDAVVTRSVEVLQQGQDEAQATLALARVNTAAPVAAVVPKVKGLSTRGVWKAECINKMALIRAIAEGKASAELVEVAQTELNKRARALGAELVVPGIRVWEEKQLASSARR